MQLHTQGPVVINTSPPLLPASQLIKRKTLIFQTEVISDYDDKTVTCGFWKCKCFMESSGNKSRPRLQGEQKRGAEQEEAGGQAREAGRGRAGAGAAGERVPAEVTGGQLRPGVVASHRSPPCSKRQTSL